VNFSRGKARDTSRGYINTAQPPEKDGLQGKPLTVNFMA
jgi:hypothetical protein